jgi:3-oxoadipate enol-lactonase
MIGGVTLILEHDLAGEGLPVVLVHSTACDRRMWDPQWDALAARFAVMRCDLRGFGGTPFPPGPFSHAEDVVALLDELGLERTALVGASGGGRVALEVAALAPERVTRLALLSTGIRDWDWSDEVKASWTTEEELWERGDLAGVADLNARTWVSPDAPPGVRDFVRAMQLHAVEVQHAAEAAGAGPETHPVELDPALLSLPTLVVCGLQDLPDFPAIARHLAREMPHATLVELETAHFPNLERPEITTALLVDFLAA